jgi:hypothetical protein
MAGNMLVRTLHYRNHFPREIAVPDRPKVSDRRSSKLSLYDYTDLLRSFVARIVGLMTSLGYFDTTFTIDQYMEICHGLGVLGLSVLLEYGQITTTSALLTWHLCGNLRW